MSEQQERYDNLSKEDQANFDKKMDAYGKALLSDAPPPAPAHFGCSDIFTPHFGMTHSRPELNEGDEGKLT